MAAFKLLPLLALVAQASHFDALNQGSCGVIFAQAADYNIVNLDNNTLKLLTGKDVPAFVRFDRDYPYGEKVRLLVGHCHLLGPAVRPMRLRHWRRRLQGPRWMVTSYIMLHHVTSSCQLVANWLD